jgi:hypothetical protein
LKSNITIEFADTIQYEDKATIDCYLDLILSELNLRFGNWKKLSLLWTALTSSKIKQTKELALLLLIQFQTNKEQFLQKIDWQLLQKLINQPYIIWELKNFAQLFCQKLEDSLHTFHRKYFQFPIHNIECEYSIANIYSYKLEASAASTAQISAVYRSKHNKTQLSKENAANLFE